MARKSHDGINGFRKIRRYSNTNAYEDALAYEASLGQQLPVKEVEAMQTSNLGNRFMISTHEPTNFSVSAIRQVKPQREYLGGVGC